MMAERESYALGATTIVTLHLAPSAELATRTSIAGHDSDSHAGPWRASSTHRFLERGGHRDRFVHRLWHFSHASECSRSNSRPVSTDRGMGGRWNLCVVWSAQLGRSRQHLAAHRRVLRVLARRLVAAP